VVEGTLHMYFTFFLRKSVRLKEYEKSLHEFLKYALQHNIFRVNQTIIVVKRKSGDRDSIR